VYTVWNTSDSKTEYVDHWGITHSVHTEPNSIMLVRAGGYKHRVLPVEKGKRHILKIAYVPKKKVEIAVAGSGRSKLTVII
jgi:hypothetical protein